MATDLLTCVVGGPAILLLLRSLRKKRDAPATPGTTGATGTTGKAGMTGAAGIDGASAVAPVIPDAPSMPVMPVAPGVPDAPGYARAAALPCWKRFEHAGRSVNLRSAEDAAEDLDLGEGRTNHNFIAEISASPGGGGGSGGVERYFVRIGGDLPAFGV